MNNIFNFGDIIRKTPKCTMCGKNFDFFDSSLDFNFKKKIGYGSIHDGDNLNLHLCCECFDKLVSLITPMCKTDPIEQCGD